MPNCYMIVQRGPEIGKRYELNKTTITLGRGDDNDIKLEDPYVSRYHAVIRQQGENIAIIDLGSENPVQIKDTPLEAGTPYNLQHRDIVRLGKFVLSYQNPEAAHARPVVLVQPKVSVSDAAIIPEVKEITPSAPELINQVIQPGSYSFAPLEVSQPPEPKVETGATWINPGFSQPQLNQSAEPTNLAVPQITPEPIVEEEKKTAPPTKYIIPSQEDAGATMIGSYNYEQYSYAPTELTNPETEKSEPVPSTPESQAYQYGQFGQYGENQYNPQSYQQPYIPPLDSAPTRLVGGFNSQTVVPSMEDAPTGYVNYGQYEHPFQQPPASTNTGKAEEKPSSSENSLDDAPTTIIRIDKNKL